MSERRRLRGAVPTPVSDVEVPEELRVYRIEAWHEPDDEDAMLDPWLRWMAARKAWARQQGYDAEAPWGAASEADWWAFSSACGS